MVYFGDFPMHQVDLERIRYVGQMGIKIKSERQKDDIK